MECFFFPPFACISGKSMDLPILKLTVQLCNLLGGENPGENTHICQIKRILIDGLRIMAYVKRIPWYIKGKFVITFRKFLPINK